MNTLPTACQRVVDNLATPMLRPAPWSHCPSTSRRIALLPLARLASMIRRQRRPGCWSNRCGLAFDFERPVLIHTLHRDKKTVRTIALVKASGNSS
jgi:hypothetical protein